MPEQPGTDPLTFEESFRRLSELTDTLEGGNLSLADATARYAESMALAQRCNQLLDEAELRISQIKESYAAPPGFEDWEEDANSAKS